MTGVQCHRQIRSIALETRYSQRPRAVPRRDLPDRPPEAGAGLVMEYFDSHGVHRTYGVSLDDGVLGMWREYPGFDQRFSATLRPDAFEGQWQLGERQATGRTT